MSLKIYFPPLIFCMHFGTCKFASKRVLQNPYLVSTPDSGAMCGELLKLRKCTCNFLPRCSGSKLYPSTFRCVKLA